MRDEADDAHVDEGIALHQRLVAGDVTVSAEIAEAFLHDLVTRLKQAHPGVANPDDYEDAAADALMSYFERPEQFDPNQLRLSSYLVMSAKGDLINRLRPRKIDENTQTLADVVELHGEDSEQEVEQQEFVALPDRIETSDPYVWDVVRTLVPDTRDQQLVTLMIQGVRETDAYAEILEISYWPKEEQEAHVKRNKDRLKKQLQRHLKLPEYHE